MSQKEKEIFEAQLMKEAEIRDRLKEASSPRFSVCLFFLKGPCRADIAVLETAHYFFDGGRGVGKFLHANIFLNVSPSSCKHFIFYLHTIYFSVYSLCKQFIPKFSTPPPPVKKIIVRPLGHLCA